MRDWEVIKLKNDGSFELDLQYDYASLPIFETKISIPLDPSKYESKYLLRISPHEVYVDLNTFSMFAEFTEDEIYEINKQYFKMLDDERDV